MDDAKRKWLESLDRRLLVGWTCSICMMVGLLTWREPVVGGDMTAWLPQAVQVEHLPHPPDAFYSRVIYMPNISIAASGENVIKPAGIASAESVGVPAFRRSWRVWP